MLPIPSNTPVAIVETDPMPSLPPLLNLIAQWGIVAVLVAVVVYGLLARARREARGENAAGKIIDNSAAVSTQWQDIVKSLMGQNQVLMNQVAKIVSDYKESVESGITRRLDHCEEEHKKASERLTEAHKRLDAETKHRLRLEEDLTRFRNAMASAAILPPVTVSDNPLGLSEGIRRHHISSPELNQEPRV